MLMLLGRPAERQEPLRRALDRAPTHPFRHNWFAFLGIAQLHAGEPALAVDSLTRSLEGAAILSVEERQMLLAAVARERRPELTLEGMRSGPPGVAPAWFAQREDGVTRGLALIALPERSGRPRLAMTTACQQWPRGLEQSGRR